MSSHEKENDTRTVILQTTWRLMEAKGGLGVRMGDIAKAAGLSRQAIYLHFTNRTALIRATTQYVDEVLGLNKRLKVVYESNGAIAFMEAYIDVWGNYIPEIAGLAKALLAARNNDDKAAAAAWDSCMEDFRLGCADIVSALEKEKLLLPHWSQKNATEMIWTLLSFQNWEQLTISCGWSTEQYITLMKSTLKSSLINTAKSP